MVGHDAMAGPAQRREIAHLFVEEICVGAVMNFECAAGTVVVADPTAKAGSLKLSKPGRTVPPTLARNVAAIVHRLPHFDDIMLSKLGFRPGKASGSLTK